MRPTASVTNEDSTETVATGGSEGAASIATLALPTSVETAALTCTAGGSLAMIWVTGARGARVMSRMWLTSTARAGATTTVGASVVKFSPGGGSAGVTASEAVAERTSDRSVVTVPSSEGESVCGGGAVVFVET